MGKSSISMAMFNGYVRLPGTIKSLRNIPAKSQLFVGWTQGYQIWQPIYIYSISYFHIYIHIKQNRQRAAHRFIYREKNKKRRESWVNSPPNWMVQSFYTTHDQYKKSAMVHGWRVAGWAGTQLRSLGSIFKVSSIYRKLWISIDRCSMIQFFFKL